MDRIEEWELREEVLAVAADAGSPLSESQLWRLHDAGLIEEPRTRSLGRGRGRESRYPPGTKDRLRRVLEVRRGAHSFEAVAWRLWWEDGGPVPRSVRERLLAVAKEFESTRRRLAGLLGRYESGEPRAEAEMETTYREAAEKRMPPGLGRLRRNVGRDEFPTLFGVMIEVATGRFRAYRDDGGHDEPSTEAVVEKGLGIDRARRDHLGEMGPWFEGNSADDLRRLSSAISTASPATIVTADDRELDAARAELRAFFQTIFEVSAILVRLLGRGALGLDTVAGVFAAMSERLQPFVLLIWMVLREDPDLRRGMAENNAVLPEATANRAAFEMLIGLREQGPAFSGLTDELLRGALLGGSGKEALDREVRRLFREHGAEVDQFIAENRELAGRVHSLGSSPKAIPRDDGRGLTC